MIPADKWPDWADRHCWDESGLGYFYGALLCDRFWVHEQAHSNIPMPAGHDWRVPVMRPTVKDSLMVSPAIDLEKIVPAEKKLPELYLAEYHENKGWNACRAKMLTLIDAQANNLNEQLGISEELPPAIDLWQFRATVERAWKASRAGSEDDLSLGKLLALIDGQASHGCGACGDACVARGSCRVRDEGPPCSGDQPAKGEGE